jgi:hypothetical protein
MNGIDRNVLRRRRKLGRDERIRSSFNKKTKKDENPEESTSSHEEEIPLSNHSKRASHE